MASKDTNDASSLIKKKVDDSKEQVSGLMHAATG